MQNVYGNPLYPKTIFRPIQTDTVFGNMANHSQIFIDGCTYHSVMFQLMTGLRHNLPHGKGTLSLNSSGLTPAERMQVTKQHRVFFDDEFLSPTKTTNWLFKGTQRFEVFDYVAWQQFYYYWQHFYWVSTLILRFISLLLSVSTRFVSFTAFVLVLQHFFWVWQHLFELTTPYWISQNFYQVGAWQHFLSHTKTLNLQFASNIFYWSPIVFYTSDVNYYVLIISGVILWPSFLCSDWPVVNSGFNWWMSSSKLRFRDVIHSGSATSGINLPSWIISGFHTAFRVSIIYWRTAEYDTKE